MNDWIATDLDGTLFSRGWGADDAIPATWRVDPTTGTKIASSWMPRGIHRAMALLQREATLVPVTARDAPSFARVGVTGLSLSGPAVICNGALILDREGRTDADWEAEMTRRLEPRRKWLEHLVALVEGLTKGCARPRLVAGPSGIPAFLVAKAPGGWWYSKAGTETRWTIDWQDCLISLHGDELTAIPPGVGKAEALGVVMHRYFSGKHPLLCFGDMPGDLEFMRLGGILATPKHSALEGRWRP